MFLFYEDVSIEPTEEQLEILEGPPTIKALKTADFLAKQMYIDDWIMGWLKSDEWESSELPLCVSESIICDPKLQKKYCKSIKHAIVHNNVQWLERHYILPIDNCWNVVNFQLIKDAMFDFLWTQTPIPVTLCPFVAQSKNIHFWKTFVDEYGPDCCIEHAARQQWYEGLEYCVDEGAELQDVVQHCVRSARMFRLVTLCNPAATTQAWEEFCLQRMLARVEDVPLVEEWFFVHGFKREYKNVSHLQNDNCIAF
tara:strand:+ start:3793 stop:4554 length:762 start_codon:yes stop_codon:yes gene_type:complete